MKKSLALLLVLGACSLSMRAQEHCLSHTITQRWLQAHGQQVDLAREASALENQGIRGNGTLTVPVVVHIVWNTNAENVSDLVVTNIINQMNNDYQALNTDFGNVRPVFAPARANAHIDFCLATVAPDGSATNGIVRYHTTKTWFDPDAETDAMKYAPDGTPAWNPLHYLNIWICDISSGATGGLVTAGYAYLPFGSMVGSAVDGLVLDRTYGTGLGDRTATHEVGHYFGLDHPWGDGNCSPGDGISDTPPTNSPTYTCTNTSLMKCNTLTQYENFMDYSNCSMMFTNGQATVMSGILNGVRSGLLSSNGCQGGTGSSLCVPTSANGTADGDFIDGVVLQGISNTGSGSATGPTYNDYTAYTATLNRNSTYTVQVTSGEYVNDTMAAWIDFNANGTLEASELIGHTATTSDFQTIPFTFTVPASAVLGSTVMRVRVTYPGSNEPSVPDPCANFSWGETEDYGIIINGPSSIVGRETDPIAIRTYLDHVAFTWGRQARDRHASVLDAAGRSVMEFIPSPSDASVPTANLAPGVYQLLLALDGEKMSVRFAVAAH